MRINSARSPRLLERGNNNNPTKIPTRVYSEREIKPDTGILRIPRAFSPESRGSATGLLVRLDRDPRAATQRGEEREGDAEIGKLSGMRNWGLEGWVGASPHWAIPAAAGGEGADGRRRCGRRGGGGRGERRRRRATSAVLEPGEDAAGI
jgi:hypothetical protein